ncbi:MAG: hypothetical protein CFE21_15685 [Bacteroidetes bacterium B1(2017)]|nr:MAG: hypothetical protein CFE21_15685 [Bacteroidetes bacterium B1(2017)]
MEKEEILKKLLEILAEDLAFYSPMIKEVSVDLIKEGFTQYPIFVAHQHEVKLGEPILMREDYAREFSIHASTLEELIEKKLVLPEREGDFKLNFKNPKEFMCILLLTPGDARFVYVPFKQKKKEN